MALKLDIFNDPQVDENFVHWLTGEKWLDLSRHFGRLWDYYQNPISPLSAQSLSSRVVNESSRSYVQAQEQGLPARITGFRQGPDGLRSELENCRRKEIVIENDIAWRINAMVDFLFGKGITLCSKAPDARRRRDIDAIIEAVIAGSGGAGFFQDMAVLGSVYGFVDCAVRWDENFFTSLGSHNTTGNSSLLSHASTTRTEKSFQEVLTLCGRVGLELIEAPRALPILDENDYRNLRCYIQHFTQPKNSLDPAHPVIGSSDSKRAHSTITEILGPCHWQRYENEQLVDSGINPLGRVPVVHIQNIAQPYYYEGISDVEQMIPLQDELNTRLSDRANRLTLQCFQMYLAKGFDGVTNRTVSPGHIWCTENTEASIESFGGDHHAPNEDLHISEIRDALDKVSGVSPVVAGMLRDKVGNLTSAVAIRMVFLGMLARNTRKQLTYGRGIAQIAELVLECLDTFGIYATDAAERKVEVEFANPLPEDMTERLKEAQIKRELGVSQEQVLSELGYE